MRFFIVLVRFLGQIISYSLIITSFRWRKWFWCELSRFSVKTIKVLAHPGDNLSDICCKRTKQIWNYVQEYNIYLIITLSHNDTKRIKTLISIPNTLSQWCRDRITFYKAFIMCIRFITQPL